MSRPVRIHIDDDERRRRLVRRHHLDGSAINAHEVVASGVALHSTDPATPHLSCWARGADDLDTAMYETRTLWRLHAMRRTLFVIDRTEAPMFHAAVGARIAGDERRKLASWLAADGASDAEDVLDRAEQAVRQVLADRGPMRANEIVRHDPLLARKVTVGSGRWASQASLASRLLVVMAAEGTVVRTRPAGSWRAGQYHWALTSDWFDHRDEPPSDPAGADEMAPDEGRDALARRYLGAFGPVRADDLRWWAGWTVARTRAALEAIDAHPVALDGGATGWVLADDVGTTEPIASPSVALLPALDPVPMGYTHRDWYLGELKDDLFDRNGNIGPTVWLDGRIIGGWAQTADGRVVGELGDQRRAVRAEVARAIDRLADRLDGEVVIPRFRTPLERRLSAA